MKAKIPKGFSLGGQDFVVKYGRYISEGNFGHTEFYNNEIVVKDNFNGRPYSKQQQEQTFFHELVHAILMIMNEHEINQNEQFVDMFGQLLYQYERSKRYK